MTLNQKVHAAKLRVLEASREYWYSDGTTDAHNELMDATAEMVALENELKEATALLLAHVHK